MFDCRFNHETLSVKCSFDGGYPWPCELPLSVEIGEFGTGHHTLLVTAISVYGQSLHFMSDFYLSDGGEFL